MINLEEATVVRPTTIPEKGSFVGVLTRIQEDDDRDKVIFCAGPENAARLAQALRWRDELIDLQKNKLIQIHTYTACPRNCGKSFRYSNQGVFLGGDEVICPDCAAEEILRLRDELCP